MDHITIRPAVLDDATVVADYHDRCFGTTYAAELAAGELKAPDLAGTQRQLEGWFREGGDVATWVAVVDDVAIGHYTLSGCQLVHLFVAPEHHGFGLGGRLLHEAEAKLAAEGYVDIELHTRVDNANAISFYEHAGRVRTDRRIHTVEHGVSYDEHVLVKRLRSGEIGERAER